MPNKCRCRGEGWYWDDERKSRVVCTCPAGWAKKQYLGKTRSERQQERKERKRRKAKEEVPF